ncbi:hypothetical protein [Paenibacillus jilunlii]|uniref:Uncharacterized protein n=1 Tax=Paenibacillus jilunlii TaxID=682956 RepID=A0A1H0A4X0_9BACL|nr:hypothetical protein [Paenibacillus jilunlii]KWX79948.1 hypothetical protein AML91_01910 [Paenibacillus jilunlii]SDN27776.1 hypothetical protein SAMN05216191_13442 [Paenibacillus jilunlii]
MTSGPRVTAKTFWVWTETAAAANPCRIPGAPVEQQFFHYGKNAPAGWLEREYIVDAEDYEGQVDLFGVVNL